MTGNLRLGFHAPATSREISDLVAEAAHAKIPLEVRGRGSKYEVGRFMQSGSVVSTEHLVGISLYEPSELVLSAAAGTLLDDIRNILAEHGQQLAFEPIDLGPVLGTHAGQSSIGGVFATNLSGSRRIQVGAARDHLLGVACINGWGEPFKSGGGVMKNVPVPTSAARFGSRGTLAVMTGVAIKVLPARVRSAPWSVFGLPIRTASRRCASPWARPSRCPAPCICMRSSPSASPTRRSPMPAPPSPPLGWRISRPPPAIAPAG